MIMFQSHVGTITSTWKCKICMMTLSNGNIFPVTGPLCGEFTSHQWFHAQRSVMWSFDVFFDLCLNKQLSKQSWSWWFEMPSWSLWNHCNVEGIIVLNAAMKLLSGKVLLMFLWQWSREHCALSSREDKPVNNRESNGWWPLLKISCLITMMQHVWCVIWLVCHNDILWSFLSQHGGCWWPGAYSAPGHLQPSWWHRPVGASEESPNLMRNGHLADCSPVFCS